MANPKFNKQKEKSNFGKILEDKKSVNDNGAFDNFKISFQYLDTSQKYGSSFLDWQKCGLLSTMMETLKGYCCRPLIEQIDGSKFTRYGDFPPSERTKFSYPIGIPEDANWARIHINNLSIVVGHIVSNTFYVVFLDKKHNFYLTKKSINKK